MRTVPSFEPLDGRGTECKNTSTVAPTLKSLFPGHYRPSEEGYDRLFKDAIIVCDANVLLNLYRYSSETRQELLRILEGFRKRLWLPYQAAAEFYRNRLLVICSEVNEYSSAQSQADQLLGKLERTRGHPYVKPETLHALKSATKSLTEELNDSKVRLEHLLTQDDTLDRLDSLFGENVGLEPTGEASKNHSEQSEKRKSLKIPPGYMDHHKDGNGPQGDGILWLQLLEHAEEKKQSVILVTDDLKDDWWQKANGKTIGPRPELVKEFKERTGQIFYMYEPGQFIKFGGLHLRKAASDEAIREASALSRHKRKAESANSERFNLLRHMRRHEREIDKFLEEVNLILTNSPSHRDTQARTPTVLRHHIIKTPCLQDFIEASQRYYPLENDEFLPPGLKEASLRLRQLHLLSPILSPALMAIQYQTKPEPPLASTNASQDESRPRNKPHFRKKPTVVIE